jgi:hypothetical protein
MLSPGELLGATNFEVIQMSLGLGLFREVDRHYSLSLPRLGR